MCGWSPGVDERDSRRWVQNEKKYHEARLPMPMPREGNWSVRVVQKNALSSRWSTPLIQTLPGSDKQDRPG